MARPAPLAEIVQLALTGDEARRRDLAGRHDSAPELLVLLAGDDLTSVRTAVAANPAAPSHADRLLCQDAAPHVRASLARKLGADAVALVEAEWTRRHPSRDALLLLARDVDAPVRGALAEALAELPDAPPELVLPLTRDLAPAVCEPLIQRSAALDEAALLALVAEAPHTRPAVARRPAVAAPVAEALLATGDRDAALALLRNPGSRVPPAALAELAERAAAMPWLQEALALHPGLPAASLARLVPRLAGEVRTRLAARRDLPHDIAAALGRPGATVLPWGG